MIENLKQYYLGSCHLSTFMCSKFACLLSCGHSKRSWPWVCIVIEELRTEVRHGNDMCLIVSLPHVHRVNSIDSDCMYVTDCL